MYGLLKRVILKNICMLSVLVAETTFQRIIKEYEEKDRENDTKTPDEEIIERIIQVGFLKST